MTRDLHHHFLTLAPVFVSTGEECLTLALKGRCQNQLKRRQAGPERLISNGRSAVGALRGGTFTTTGGSRLVERAVGGLCEVHFLPLVVGVGDSNRTQRLRCVGTSYIFSVWGSTGLNKTPADCFWQTNRGSPNSAGLVL